MKIDTWTRMYPSQWKGKIVEAAFRHPAKYSSRLIRAIYDHLLSEDWVKPGDIVVDPFGGVALGALDAMRLGLSWLGVELEAHFVEAGCANIDLWSARFSSMPRWGNALLVQGDSRNLSDILSGAQSVVSSSPYADGNAHTVGDDSHPEHIKGGKLFGVGIAGALSSPPYADSINQKESSGDVEKRFERMRKAGIDVDDPAKSGGPNSSLKTRQNYSAAVSSPPYSDSDQDYQGGWARFHANHAPLGRNDAQREAQYGEAGGQLGAMKSTDAGFQAAVSSPPFLQSSGGKNVPEGMEKTDPGLGARHAAGNKSAEAYGNTDGQLTNGTLDDFWLSARRIVEQVYQVLEPGGHAVWVVKDYVKNKQRVPFCDQWRELCEAVGFVALHEHRALLVNHRGTSLTLEGGEIHHQTESKSFFRRLAEKKGSPRIDWESVLCMEKPA